MSAVVAGWCVLSGIVAFGWVMFRRATPRIEINRPSKRIGYGLASVTRAP